MPYRYRSIIAVLLLAMVPASIRADSAQTLLEMSGVRGGFAVHVGCGDGSLLSDFARSSDLLIHAVDTSPVAVHTTRQQIQSVGHYGRVSVDTFDGLHLPYIDNVVNLLVCRERKQLPMEEVLRVLSPGGVACVHDGERWQKTVKPWPDDIDQWTHFLHGPDNNAVARDSVVDVPRRLQWLGEPKYARAHEQTASLGGSVTASGRLFTIIDEASRADIRFPSQWSLIARDAFNGVVLWKRPVASWVDQLRRFRSGPAETPFRLAALDDFVYVTLGIDAPVSILDAATGQTRAVCEGTDNARQILRLDDRLIVLIDTSPPLSKEQDSAIRRGLEPAPGKRAILAADAVTGKMLWHTEIEDLVHPSLAAQGQQVFYQTNQSVHALDMRTGDQVWQTEMKMQLSGHELGWESPTLVVHEGIVYSADFKQIMACGTSDGKVLWRAPSQSGYNSPPDVFVIGDTVWTKGKGMIGRDPATGKVQREIAAVGGYMHPRCYRNKATERFFVLGNQGVQFLGLESEEAVPNHWIRGTCQYGILPANGLLYVTPDSCACNMKTKLSGLWTLAPETATEANDGASADSGPRLVRGPAFGKLDEVESALEATSDWPTFRHDAARRGVTPTRIPSTIQPAWRAEVGGRLSALSVARGRVLVASMDEHAVYALDETDGDVLWTFTAGGRIDSPPTLYRGLALFGSADGHVYALRATDGALVWRFRAAPVDRRTYVNGQLESVWPVHGSVLVDRDRLLFTAGRSSYLDGGIRIFQLDPRTGRMQRETVMYSPDSETGQQDTGGDRRDYDGALTDVLLADGDDVYMRHVRLDLADGNMTGTGQHLFSPIGLLDDTWWHRGYWLFSDQFVAHWSGWWRAGNVVPSGRILSYDESTIYGYGRDKYPSGNTGQWRGGERYRLFACDRPASNETALAAAAAKPNRRERAMKPPTSASSQDRWSVSVPFHVRAMLVADDAMFIAGPPELSTAAGQGEEALALAEPLEAVAAWNGERGASLWVVSTTEGKPLAKHELDAAPVFDGMAAAGKRLYVSLCDGSVVCYAP